MVDLGVAMGATGSMDAVVVSSFDRLCRTAVMRPLKILYSDTSAFKR